MKTRNGLVSNSSSSSFVIAFKKTAACPCCGRTPQTILDIIESKRDYNDDYRINARGADEVIKNLLEYTYDGDTRSQETVAKIKSLDSDMEIAYVTVSQHDQVVLDEIRAIGKMGGLILSEGGD